MQRIILPQIKEQIIEMLLDQIYSGQLCVGMELRQEMVAEQMNVSRMPVREAFQHLEMSGYLIRLPTQRMQVAPLSAVPLKQVVRTLKAIETEVARILLEARTDVSALNDRAAAFSAAVQSTPNAQCLRLELSFHEALFGLVRNNHVEAIARQLLREYIRFILRHSKYDPRKRVKHLSSFQAALHRAECEACVNALSLYHDELCNAIDENWR